MCEIKISELYASSIEKFKDILYYAAFEDIFHNCAFCDDATVAYSIDPKPRNVCDCCQIDSRVCKDHARSGLISSLYDYDSMSREDIFNIIDEIIELLEINYEDYVESEAK